MAKELNGNRLSRSKLNKRCTFGELIDKKNIFILYRLVKPQIESVPRFSCLTIIFFAWVSSAYAEPVTYAAEYVARYQGLPVRAKGIRELKKTGDGSYRLVSAAQSMLIKVGKYELKQNFNFRFKILTN